MGNFTHETHGGSHPASHTHPVAQVIGHAEEQHFHSGPGDGPEAVAHHEEAHVGPHNSKHQHTGQHPHHHETEHDHTHEQPHHEHEAGGQHTSSGHSHPIHTEHSQV